MKFLPVCLVIGALAVSGLPFVSKLPYSMQRSLAWIPGVAAPQVREEARHSTQWRLEIWKRTRTEIPQYLLLGKGYTLDIHELEIADFRRREMREREQGELSELTVDYHSGPLSVLIPFGLIGVAGLVWFWIAGVRLLLRYYRCGPPELKGINRFLLAFFCARIVHFVVIFGSFHTKFNYSTGLVGFSVALNHGVAVLQPTSAKDELWQREPARRLRPSFSPPAPART